MQWYENPLRLLLLFARCHRHFLSLTNSSGATPIFFFCEFPDNAYTMAISTGNNSCHDKQKSRVEREPRALWMSTNSTRSYGLQIEMHAEREGGSSMSSLFYETMAVASMFRFARCRRRRKEASRIKNRSRVVLERRKERVKMTKGVKEKLQRKE